MKRRVIGLVLLGFVGWSFFQPSIRKRADSVIAKLAGERPGVSWAQTLVSLAPGEWRPAIRSGLLRVAHSFESAANASLPWARDLAPPAPQDEFFELRPLFDGPTSAMGRLDVHISTLEAGRSPHAPHRHDDEELIVPLSGALEVVLGEADQQSSLSAGPGQLLYYSSGILHSIRAGGEEAARYLVFKWWGAEAHGDEPPLRAGVYEFSAQEQALAEHGRAFEIEPVLEAPTRFLSRLHAHVSRAEPDGGYPEERDPYDIAMVLLSGSVVTQRRQVDAPAVVFHPAGELHGVRGAGVEAARYLVIEFHGRTEFEGFGAL